MAEAPPTMYKADKKDLDNALTIAGRSIRLKLKGIYGSPEEAHKALMEKAQDIEGLEAWGRETTGEPFTFSDMPGHMREKAIWSMAAARLVYEGERLGVV